MKKVININFHGTIVPIEEGAYEILKQYIESLRVYFAEEEGKEEIINDIESRISELFQERIKAGATCITEMDVAAIIKNIGRPEDFDDADGEAGESKKKTESQFEGFKDWSWKNKRLYRDENNKILGGVCSGLAAYLGIDPVIVRVLFIISGIGFFAYLLLWVFVPGSHALENGVRKRLYRNPDGKIIAGVCNGLGSYFNVSAWIPRVLFLLPFISFIFRWGQIGPITFPHFLSFSFSPSTFLIYIILWLVIPEANSTSEKLEMKGEKVDINSIKNSVMKEMKEVGERVGKMGQEASAFAREKGPEIGAEIHHAVKKTSGTFGHIISVLIKVILYIILGFVGLMVIVALFVIAAVAIGIFPLKDFIINDGWQSVFAWGTLIFFIGVPVVGIITFIIRRIGRVKSSNKFVRYSFSGLWLIGLVSFILLISSVARDFKGVSSMNDEKFLLANPQMNTLTIKAIQDKDLERNGWLSMEPYERFGVMNDTAYIGNISIQIKQSPTDSFRVSVVKSANGNTRRYADTLASLIRFNMQQVDSVLYMSRALAINTTDKFRNQNVEVTIYVPIGHGIIIDKAFSNTARIRVNWFWDRNRWYYDDEDTYDYDYGTYYIMKKDGLYTSDGQPYSSISTEVTESEDWNTDMESPTALDSIKKVKKETILKLEREVDSLKKAEKLNMDRTKDSLKKVQEEINQKLKNLNKGTAEVNIDPQPTDVHYGFMMDI